MLPVGNHTASPLILPSLPKGFPAFLTPSKKSFLEKLHLIDERGLLLTPQTDIDPTIAFSDRSQARLTKLLERTLKLVDKFGNSGPTISLEDYLYYNLQHPDGYPIETFLRGTSAFFVIDIPAIMKKILPDNPEFSECLKRIEEEWLQMEMPSDFDILDVCAFATGLFNKAKDALAELTGLSAGQAHPFYTKIADGRVESSLHGPPQEIFITTIRSKELTVDRVMGTLTVPHLFKRDDLRIGMNGPVQIISDGKDLAQTVIHRVLKIVLFEKRHTKDFQAALAALHLFTRGHQIIETTGTLYEAFEALKGLSHYDKLVRSISNRIESHEGDWGFFLMNVCHYLEKVLSSAEVEEIFSKVRSAHAESPCLIDISKGSYAELKEALYAVGELSRLYELGTILIEAVPTTGGIMLSLDGHQMLLSRPDEPAETITLFQKQLLVFRKMRRKPNTYPVDQLYFKDPRLNLLLELSRQKPLTPLSKDFIDALEIYLSSEEKPDLALAQLLQPLLLLKDNWNITDICLALAESGHGKRAVAMWFTHTTQEQRETSGKGFFESILKNPHAALFYFTHHREMLQEAQLQRLFSSLLVFKSFSELLSYIRSPLELKVFLSLLKNAEEPLSKLEFPLQEKIDALSDLNGTMQNNLLSLWNQLYPHSNYLLHHILKKSELDPARRLLLIEKSNPKDLELLEVVFPLFQASTQPIEYLLKHHIHPQDAQPCWEIALQKLSSLMPCPQKHVLGVLKNETTLDQLSKFPGNLVENLFKILAFDKIAPQDLLQLLNSAKRYATGMVPRIAAQMLASNVKYPAKNLIKLLVKYPADPACCKPLLDFLIEKKEGKQPHEESLIRHYGDLFAKIEYASQFRHLVEQRKDPVLGLSLLEKWRENPEIANVLLPGLLKLSFELKMHDDQYTMRLIDVGNALYKKQDFPNVEVPLLLSFTLMTKAVIQVTTFQKNLSFLIDHINFFPVEVTNPDRFDIYYMLLVFIEDVCRSSPEWDEIPLLSQKLIHFVEQNEISSPPNNPMPPLLLFYLSNQLKNVIHINDPDLSLATLNMITNLGMHFSYNSVSFPKIQNFIELLISLKIVVSAQDAKASERIHDLLNKLILNYHPSSENEENQWLACLHWGLQVPIQSNFKMESIIMAYAYWLMTLSDYNQPILLAEARRLYVSHTAMLGKIKPGALKELEKKIFQFKAVRKDK